MKTKVIATIGPKSEDRETLSRLITAGLDVARMNFSHCTEEEYKARRAIIKEESEKQGRKVAIQMDLQGPRVRIGKIAEGERILAKDDVVTFTTTAETEGKIFIDYAPLADAIQVGHPIYLSSGELELTVTEKNGADFKARVVRGGGLLSRKGVNVPETQLDFGGLTEKDVKDLAFGLEQGVDYVAVSFVQTAEDIKAVQEIVKGRARIIAKIESAQALRNIDEIIRVTDSIMVARGDLGVELPMEKVPFVQKHLIRQAHWHNKGAVVATQMLLSMMHNKKPTRAEVSDIANAVLDGADAIMLSDEISNGEYPVEALETAVRIASETEKLFHETDNLL